MLTYECLVALPLFRYVSKATAIEFMTSIPQFVLDFKCTSACWIFVACVESLSLYNACNEGTIDLTCLG